MSPGEPFDAGLQPERTLLAWQRTALALALAGAVAVHLVAAELGPVGIVAAVAAIALAAGCYLAAAARYRRVHRSLLALSGLRSSAAPLAVLAGTAVLVASVAAAFVFARALA